MSGAIKLGMSVARGIAVHARGTPATIVAVGAAAAVAGIGTAIAYGVYESVAAPPPRRRLPGASRTNPHLLER